MKKQIRKMNNSNSNDYLEELSKRIVLFMHDKNMPLTSILTENVIEFIPRRHPIYETMIEWDYHEQSSEHKWYGAKTFFLYPEGGDGILQGNRLSFTYDAVRFKILKNYILYKITWR